MQVAAEFTTTSISAPGYDSTAKALPAEYQQVFLDLAREGLYISNNNTLKYANLRQRGELQSKCLMASSFGGTCIVYLGDPMCCLLVGAKMFKRCVQCC